MIKAKRFWENVSVVATGDEFGIYLDSRKLMTPLKTPLVLHSRKMAEDIAAEWREVDELILPETMPMTKRANSAIEYVMKQRADVEGHLLSYLESDLLCYRADAPAELVEMQDEWDIWIKWVEQFGIKLTVTSGVMPITQPEGNQAFAQEWLSRWNHFQMASIYDFITLTGSFVLGQAVAEKAMTAEKAFELSRLDQIFQEKIWGVDDLAAEHAELKRNDIMNAHRFFENAI